MKFSLPEASPSDVKNKVLDALGGKELSKIVDFEFSDKNLIVTISKLGISKLTFDQEKTSDGMVYTLKNEKIAFTHKAFKGDVMSKILTVIEGIGGKILEA